MVKIREGGTERRVTEPSVVSRRRKPFCSSLQSAGLKATAPQPVRPWQ
jgi:hypothetical protein